MLASWTSASALVPIVGATFAALGRRLPRVFRVAKLALGQLVETLLLAAKQLELALALVGVDVFGRGALIVGADVFEVFGDRG